MPLMLIGAPIDRTVLFERSPCERSSSNSSTAYADFAVEPLTENEITLYLAAQARATPPPASQILSRRHTEGDHSSS